MICNDTVECCGRLVAATVEVVQSVMTAQGLDAAGQAREWLRVARLRPEPAWMELCLAQAERMTALVQRERAVLEAVGGSGDLAAGGTGRRQPAGALAERRFEWLGDRRGIPLEVLRDGIGELARRGLIAPDAEQQAALRRGLGVAVNAAERTSRAPWVRWLGEADMLNYMVESLWRMELLHCPGGRRYKWQTLCGVFLRADGSCFEPSIKSNRCHNPDKCRMLDEALLTPLRFVCAPRTAEG